MEFKTAFELAKGGEGVITGFLSELSRSIKLFVIEVNRIFLLNYRLSFFWQIKAMSHLSCLFGWDNFLIHLEDLQVYFRMLELFWFSPDDFVDLSFIFLR